MKVVLVSSFPAFPATAGNRSRIRQLALALKESGHDLTFVLLQSRWDSPDDAAHEAAFGTASYVKIEKKHWIAKWARDVALGGAKRVLRLAGIEAAYYSPLDRFRDRGFMAGLQQLDLRPDVVIVEYVLDSWAFEAFPKSARRVLDTHDAFADRHKGYVERGIQNYWVSLRTESENKGFRRAHVVLAIQQEEAARFREQLASERRASDPEVSVVSHLLELDGFEADYEIDDSAVFVASDNPANRHAINAFVEKILPLLVKDIPGFNLKLAGSICNGMRDVPNVTKLGWVDDVKTIFAQAPLSINPMLAGTGINIKLLEAMALGVPTVSTATGARGVPESVRSGIVVVPDDDAPAFAGAMARLARDRTMRRAMGLAGRRDAGRWNAAQLAELNRCLAAP